MKQMTWEAYYDGFFDWSPATRKKYAGRLSGFGTADEVWEITQELEFDDSAFAAKFLQKAFDAGVRFTPEQVMEMVLLMQQPFLDKAAEQATGPFDEEQLEEIYLSVSEDAFRRISHRAGIRIFDDPDPGAKPKKQSRQQEKPRAGLLDVLAALLLGTAKKEHGEKQNSRRCSGDCANCPPHYGYRYGRWYYGKGHQYGCEFGGNCGDANL